jgi:hypothetical protein
MSTMRASYLKVEWKHYFSDEPVLLYSELDGERWELRKVEIFPDGTVGYAGPDVSVGGTELGQEPVPSFEQIAADPQFAPIVIGAPEFEAVWAKATA